MMSCLFKPFLPTIAKCNNAIAFSNGFQNSFFVSCCKSLKFCSMTMENNFFSKHFSKIDKNPLSPYPGAWTEIKKKETVVFFDDPTEGHVKSAEEMLENTSDDYVKFPDATDHPSRKPSTAKIQVLKMFATHLSGEKRGAAPVGSLRIEGKQLQVACLDEWLNIQELQLSGKKRMDAAAFLNGMKDIAYYECQRKDIKDDF